MQLRLAAHSPGHASCATTHTGRPSSLDAPFTWKFGNHFDIIEAFGDGYSIMVKPGIFVRHLVRQLMIIVRRAKTLELRASPGRGCSAQL